MHIGHIILIKAESHDDAIERVRLHLHDEVTFASGWSDWSVIGNDGWGGSSFSFRNDYEDWAGVSEHAVSQDDEGDLFAKVVNAALEARESEFERLRDRLSERGFSYSLDQDDMEAWELHRFAQLAESIYNPYSMFYDLANFTANPKDFRASESDEGWYAVLVDFHY